MAIGAIPGEITLQYMTTQTVLEEQEHRSGRKHVDSMRDKAFYEPNVGTGGHNNDETMDFVEQATPGWEIIPGTRRFVEVLAPNEGQNTHLAFLAETINDVRFRCSTRHTMFGCSGFIEFAVSFSEQRQVRKDNPPTSQKIILEWGESYSFVPGEDWKKDAAGLPMWTILFRPANANPADPALESTAPINTPHFEIIAEGQGFKITPKVPRELAE